MSEEKKISRRKYVAYAGAGVVSGRGRSGRRILRDEEAES
jgi:hypothetical protein